MSEKWHVGQTVLIRNVNSRAAEPRRGEVVKVGRTLVTVKAGWAEDKYRMDTGYLTGDYSHQWIVTEEEYADSLRRDAAHEKLREARVDIRGAKNLTTSQLERILEIVEEES